MDEYLLNVVLVRVMIEHRLTDEKISMAQAIGLVAQEVGLSARYVNMVLIGDKRNRSALESIEDAVTRLSDAKGGVPSVCCSPEALEVLERSIRNG